jgi:predicted nucleotidyltransferase component of viral defense system
VDVNLRAEEVATERRLVSPEYDDIVPFLITAFTIEHLFTEKVRALLIRGKARDFYDLWFLVEQGVPVNLELVNAKLALYRMRFDRKRLQRQIESVGKTWGHDLQPLLAQVPDFTTVGERLLRAFAVMRNSAKA